MPLLTVGYEKRSIDEYVNLLREHRVQVVLDVRESAWSHKPGFSKSAFSAALAKAGIRYVHAQFAGNPKWLRSMADDHGDCLDLYRDYLDEHPEIMDALDAVLRAEGVARRRIALTCFERHPGDCHRGILADEWAERCDRRVSHLEPDGCKRMLAS